MFKRILNFYTKAFGTAYSPVNVNEGDTVSKNNALARVWSNKRHRILIICVLCNPYIYVLWMPILFFVFPNGSIGDVANVTYANDWPKNLVIGLSGNLGLLLLYISRKIKNVPLLFLSFCCFWMPLVVIYAIWLI